MRCGSRSKRNPELTTDGSDCLAFIRAPAIVGKYYRETVTLTKAALTNHFESSIRSIAFPMASPMR